MRKVDELGIGNDVIDLVMQGYSYREMEQVFKKRGIDISRRTIRRWVEDNQNLIDKMGQQDEQIKKRTLSQFLDAQQQLLFMNQEAKRIYQESAEIGDRLNAIRALDLLGKNLKLFSELVGKPQIETTTSKDLFKLLSPNLRERIEDELNSQIPQ